MLASTWLDLVIGIDLHFELVPPVMAPIPFPHPFVGLVFDPWGLLGGLVISNLISVASGGALQGPVIINLMPANTTGTEAKNWLLLPHFIIPPGVIWAPMVRVPKPSIIPGKPIGLELPIPPPGDAMMITGSKTVHAMGANLCRLGDIALSCSDPIRLPTSVALTIPKGMPVLVGGPPAVDWAAAAMALIKCKWIADRLHALASRIKNARLRGIANWVICFFTGHPVDVATGRVVTRTVDFELPDLLPLRFERVYSSSWSGRASPVGFGWSHSLDQAIWTEMGKVVYRAGDGREIEFDTFDLPDRSLAIGGEMFEPMSRLTLRNLGASRWEVETPAGITHELAPIPGDADKTVARLLRMRSRQGHTVTLHYDGDARLAWAQDSRGRIVRFEYDEAGRLVLVSLPHPTQPGWLPHTRYTYSLEGDLVEVTDPLGSSVRYEYVGHLLVRETDREGLSFYFGYDGTGPDAYCIRTWGDGGIFDHEIDYDKAGRVTFVTDSLGATTTYEMNIMNAVVKVTDPMGGVTRHEYDEHLWKTAVVDPLGRVVRYAYDARGNFTRVIHADGAEVHVEYDARGLPVRVEDPCGGEQRFRYDEHGQLVERKDQVGRALQRTYERGRVASFVDEAGQRVALAYDDAGDLSGVRAEGGRTRALARDRLGRVVRVLDERGGAQQRHYDAAGRLVIVEAPDGNVERIAYDREGHIIEVQDHHRRTRFVYDGYYRLSLREEAGERVRFEHDTEGRLTAIVNELGEVSRFERDRCGRIVREIGFDGTATAYARDAAGQVIEVRKPSGAWTKKSYDAAGRVVLLRRSDGTEERYRYRRDGTLEFVKNDDATVTFERDAVGRVRRELQGDHWVASRYDANGGRDEITSSLGLSVDVERDARRDVQAITASLAFGAAPWRMERSRDGTGIEVERRLPGGLRVCQERDVAGRPTSQRVLRGDDVVQDLAFHWTTSRLVRRVDAARGPTAYAHDARGRLTAARTPDGRTEHRAADAAGRVYRDPSRTDRRYRPGGALAEADGATFRYDLDGNLVERRGPDGARFRFAYHASGLLKEVERPDGTVVAFRYDGLGRRIKKVAGGVETTWVWDGCTPLHEIVEGEEPVTWIFDPTGPTAIGRVQGRTQQAAVTDQSGAPLLICDDAGAILWRGEIDLFGRARIEGGGVRWPWRWPGQYEDGETGLLHNGFRYYDAETGRYLTLDPLGLVAGLDPYSYVADPLTQVDPLGLDQHHTIPRSFMDALVNSGLITAAVRDELYPIIRPSDVAQLVDLIRRPQNLHCDVHSALSDFLNAKYPDLNLRRGFQPRTTWQQYIDHLTGENRLANVLSDLDEFYGTHLPTTGVLDSLDDAARLYDDLKNSFDYDSGQIVDACR